MDRVNESIRITSLNVFVFLKAFPLADVENQIQVGPITQKHNNFKNCVIQNMKKEKKIIQVKFDILTRESLKLIKNHGCRVLHLSSDEFRDLQLWAEGKYGELDWIEISDLREILIPLGGRLSIDVVVLAIPKSRMLAEIFIDLGVPHVIYFDFSEEFYHIYSNIDSAINAPYECIYSFCAEFYKRIIKGSTVKHALNLGKVKMKETLRQANKILKIQNLSEQQIGEGPLLLPEDFDHNQPLYGKDWKSTELKTGELIDMSRIRGPTNIEKSNSPFTGRKLEIYQLAKDLTENNLVTLWGPMGIGKTHLAKSLSYFLNSRYFFTNGNYYFDLKYVKTTEYCRRLLKNENWNYMNESTLLIFDHADNIWKKQNAQFRWWILDITTRFKTTILLITRNKTTDQLQNGNSIIVKTLELGPLTEFESADLLIAYSGRIKSIDDIGLPNTNLSLHKALELEPNLSMCSGVPHYIMKLSELLELNDFSNINIKKMIPAWMKKEIKRKATLTNLDLDHQK